MTENGGPGARTNPLKSFSLEQIETAIATALSDLTGAELQVRALGVNFVPDGRDSPRAAADLRLHVVGKIHTP